MPERNVVHPSDLHTECCPVHQRGALHMQQQRNGRIILVMRQRPMRERHRLRALQLRGERNARLRDQRNRDVLVQLSVGTVPRRDRVFTRIGTLL